jgi:hypothetical protein
MLLKLGQGEGRKGKRLAERFLDVVEVNLGGGERLQLDGPIGKNLHVRFAKLIEGRISCLGKIWQGWRLTLVKDEILDGAAGRHFQHSLPDPHQQIFGLRLPLACLDESYLTDSKGLLLAFEWKMSR